MLGGDVGVAKIGADAAGVGVDVDTEDVVDIDAEVDTAETGGVDEGDEDGGSALVAAGGTGDEVSDEGVEEGAIGEDGAEIIELVVEEEEEAEVDAEGGDTEVCNLKGERKVVVDGVVIFRGVACLVFVGVCLALVGVGCALGISVF